MPLFWFGYILKLCFGFWKLGSFISFPFYRLAFGTPSSLVRSSSFHGCRIGFGFETPSSLFIWFLFFNLFLVGVKYPFSLCFFFFFWNLLTALTFGFPQLIFFLNVLSLMALFVDLLGFVFVLLGCVHSF